MSALLGLLLVARAHDGKGAEKHVMGGWDGPGLRQMPAPSHSAAALPLSPLSPPSISTWAEVHVPQISRS